MWNDEFQLPDGSYSVSDVQDFMKYIIKKHETLPTNPHLHIDISRNYNRSFFGNTIRIAN